MRFRSIWLSIFSGIVSVCLFSGQALPASIELHLQSLKQFTWTYRLYTKCVMHPPLSNSPCHAPGEGKGLAQLLIADISSANLDSLAYGQFVDQLVGAIEDMVAALKEVNPGPTAPAFESVEGIIRGLRDSLLLAKSPTALQVHLFKMQKETTLWKDSIESWKQFPARKADSQRGAMQMAPEDCDYHGIQPRLIRKFPPPRPILHEFFAANVSIAQVRYILRAYDNFYRYELERRELVLPKVSMLELADLAFVLLHHLDERASLRYRSDILKLSNAIKARNELVRECNGLRRKLQGSR